MSGSAVWALVPVKRLDRAKTRLAAALDAGQRAWLQLAMLTDVLRALRSVSEIDHVVVLTRDPAVDRHCASLCSHIVFGEGIDEGLNHAVDIGLTHLAPQQVSAICVFPADIPGADPHEVAMAIDRARRLERTVVIPDRDRQGTNGVIMLGNDRRSLAFGPDSYRRHMAMPWRRKPLGLHLPSIAEDIDDPRDLHALPRIAGTAGARETLEFVRQHLTGASCLQPAEGAGT